MSRDRRLLRILAHFRRNPAALIAVTFLVIMAIAGLLAPFLAPHDPLRVNFDHVRQPPDATHLLGTDRQGRDILSRLLYGARISLAVGFLSQAPTLLIGAVAGCAAGYRGRWLDAVIMRVADVFFAFPTALLLVALVTLFGRSFGSVLLALTITAWAPAARLVRGQVLRLRSEEFVTAARSIGASDLHIIRAHILPNVAGTLLVSASLGFPGAILAEAGLSFLGLGLLPPAPSWGVMLADGFTTLRSAPHMALYPSLTIGLTMLAFLTLSDSLRDILDPRTFTQLP
jgi:ABC-type dipeptide/oligopeptide/nickel transport system permease subunit